MTSFSRRGVMRARHNADSRLCRYLPLTQSYNTNHNNVFRRVHEICNALVDKKKTKYLVVLINTINGECHFEVYLRGPQIVYNEKYVFFSVHTVSINYNLYMLLYE